MPMQRVTADHPEAKSLDVVAQNIEQLKRLFPEVVVEGKINFDVLRQILGDAVESRDEKFGLNWHGKRQARQLALTPTTGTLRPCPAESVEWSTTQNIFIEGDNLEVLKQLQKSYAGQVKLIYIDPPYNTGNEFIYPDDFSDSIRNYEMLTSQRESDGRRMTTNSDSSGRYHTAWLTMMYPRLKLAHSLLRPDGAIFISIDDCEVDNLRKLCSEIFGEENFVATVLWQKVYSPKNSAKHFSEDHDYIIVYAKDASVWRPTLLPRSEEADARYENIDDDPRGPWKPSDLTARNYYSKGLYEVTGPTGRTFTSGTGRYWRQSREAFDDMVRDNRIWWGPDGNAMPAQKRFLSEVQQGIVPQTMWFYKDVGHTQEAKKELLEHVKFESNDNVLNSVKPTRLLQRILQIGTTKDGGDLVIDFFAGSAPTGHAVLQQNKEDGGNRRFILVQMHEPLPSPTKAMQSIFDIGMARLRSVIEGLRRDTPQLGATELDLGIRIYKMASSNIRSWIASRENLASSIESAVEHLERASTEEDLLCELLLKRGLDLCVPIESKTITGKKVHSVGAGSLIACLDTKITRADGEAVALGIAKWHKELNPAGETAIVFRDDAFVDDVVKTNVAAILEQHGLKNVRSL
jgi:adenine-specific DNA-methyltransferase